VLGRVAGAALLTAAASTHALAADAVVPVKAQAQTADGAQQWQLFYNQEVRYFSWRGDRGFPAAFTTQRGSGSQLYTPATISLTGVTPDVLKFEFVGRGGYVDSKQTTPGLSGSVSHLTDTVGSGTWTYLALPGVQPYLSLNVNAPTGKSVLPGTEGFARMDPDLVDIPTFGEGWNFGGTVGMNVALAENVIGSLAVGHTIRNNYDRDNPSPAGSLGIVNLSPGDVTTLNAALGFRHGALTSQISGSYAHEGTTSFNGVPAFQLGDRIIVLSQSSYAWNEASVTSLTVSWNHFQKNRVLSPPPLLVSEAFNSNSNVYRVRLEHAFSFGTWSVGPIVSWLLRDENAYSPTAFQFVPAKTRWSAGGTTRYQVNDRSLFYATVEHIWIEEENRPVAPPGGAVPDISQRGWAAAVGGTFRF
jgi:hypothetical protein